MVADINKKLLLEIKKKNLLAKILSPPCILLYFQPSSKAWSKAVLASSFKSLPQSCGYFADARFQWQNGRCRHRLSNGVTTRRGDTFTSSQLPQKSSNIDTSYSGCKDNVTSQLLSRMSQLQETINNNTEAFWPQRS